MAAVNNTLARLSMCASFLVLAVAWPQQLDPNRELTQEQRRQVLDEAWDLVNRKFYDPNLNGTSWRQVKLEFAPRFDAAQTVDQTANLLRQMLATLRASHVGLLTRAERRQTEHVLPFFFEHVGAKLFVSYVFEPKDGPAPEVKAGDELLSVDGLEAKSLRLPSVTFVYPVFSNPYYGPADSIADVCLRRSGVELRCKVRRVKRFSDIRAMVTRHLAEEISYVRFLKFDSTTVPIEEISAMLAEISSSKSLILDVRNCVGGDGVVNSLLSSAFLGEGKPMYASLRRGMMAADTERNMAKTEKSNRRFRGPVAVLVNENTESEPEIFTAVLQEYRRVHVLGAKTRGAFNGATEGIGLPFGAGGLAIPVTRTVTQQRNEYEGRGVQPDEAVVNTEQDFAGGRDAVIERAVECLRNITTH